VVEEKAVLMKKLGKKKLTLHLAAPLAAIPAGLGAWRLAMQNGGADLEYTYDAEDKQGIASLLGRLAELGVGIKDLQTSQSSLEDIFVDLINA